jgi:oxygen-independent coproporphyrinogen-3 oxidase
MSSDLDPSVALVAASGAGHLSVYELTIEERTAFGRAARAGRLRPLDPDRVARLYTAVHHHLTGRGYEHYEISSYALPGQRAVHNQLYWHGGEYLGLGTGAASFRYLGGGGAERVTNVRAVRSYLAATGGARPRARADARVAEREFLSPAAVAADAVWLALRTCDGAPAQALSRAPALVDWLVACDLAKLRGGRVRPTLKGFLHADHIATRVVAELGESG